jgi:NTE family protein
MGNHLSFGLALSGGGARGLAHIGVLTVFEREGLLPDVIVGSSIGAVIGAAFAVEPDASLLRRQIAEVFGPGGSAHKGFRRLAQNHRHPAVKRGLFQRLSDFADKEFLMNMALIRGSLLSENELQECVSPFVADLRFSDTRIPFAVTAVDLITGRRILIKDGSMRRAVMASSALPGLMPPIAWDGMLLADGAMLDAVPAVASQEMGARTVIGVDMGSRLENRPDLRDGVDVVQRATEIMMLHMRSAGRRVCDALVEPDVGAFSWTDFERYEDIIQTGELAAQDRLPEIRRALRRGYWAFQIQRLRERLTGRSQED